MKKDIIEAIGINCGAFKIRKCVDDSGDCERHTYDVLDCYAWGSNYITGEISNPKIAKLFATSPEMLEALIRCAINLEENKDLLPAVIWKTWSEYFIKIIQKSTGMIWEDVKELLY